MYKIKNMLRTSLIYLAVVILAGSYPAAAFAVETAETAPTSEQTLAPVTPAPEPDVTHTYNAETESWDSNKWALNPGTGSYEPVVMPLETTEEQAKANDNTPSQTSHEPESSSTDITVDTQATIDNNLNSNATTGNAAVDSNTTAGNAATGDASAVATIMNTINSSVSVSGAEFSTFVTDIVGDVHGDIMLYPMLLAAMLNAATHPDDATLAVNTSAEITNDIDLKATSGDAAVTNNTTAGNATSGTANTVANVMNIINSIIAANESFVGTVNIYGNLDGDILVAPDFLPQLLASNGGSESGSLAVSSEDTQSIVNNINLSAMTGDATVTNNTSAGNATTGNAATNLVLLNLSGHKIVASDSLLVFVNVLGQWVGIIVDAPAGASAAALGNGVTTNDRSPDLSVDVNSDNKIVNNLNLHSESGDATVANNTTAGNATTGNATASANVANISGSQMGLSGWFGVLFINVFGSWLGSFGVDTERGNPRVTPGQTAQPGYTPPAGSPSTKPFQFVAKQATSPQRLSVASESVAVADTQQPALEVQEAEVTEEVASEVAGASTSAKTQSGGTITPPEAEEQFDFIPLMTAAFMVGLGALAMRHRW